MLGDNSRNMCCYPSTAVLQVLTSRGKKETSGDLCNFFSRPGRNAQFESVVISCIKFRGFDPWFCLRRHAKQRAKLAQFFLFLVSPRRSGMNFVQISLSL